VNLPTPVIFSCIFDVIIWDSQLPKCSETRLKRTKLRIKRPIIVLGWDSEPNPVRGAYDQTP